MDRMKRAALAVAAAAFLLGGASRAFADHHMTLHVDYNAPISAPGIGSNLEFGGQYRFWGIFLLEASIYTNIVYGADNLFNIAGITPLGLFSGGIGMRIPLGGIGFEMGWSRFYSAVGSTAVEPYCTSFRIGVDIRLDESVSLRAYSQTLYDLSGSAHAAGPRIDTIGGGLGFHLF